MRKRLFLFLPLLASAALAACSVQDKTVSAYRSDDFAPAALDGTCKSLADTGDMYRYCMEYGPQQAMAR
jgi:hypothetical protein